jgi:hypothetical protein
LNTHVKCKCTTLKRVKVVRRFTTILATEDTSSILFPCSFYFSWYVLSAALENHEYNNLLIFFQIIIVALDIALIVVFRIFMKTKVFPDNVGLKIIFGDLVSTIFNLIAILLMDKVRVHHTHDQFHHCLLVYSL